MAILHQRPHHLHNPSPAASANVERTYQTDNDPNFLLLGCRYCPDFSYLPFSEKEVVRKHAIRLHSIWQLSRLF
jgi:hypothetical protein